MADWMSRADWALRSDEFGDLSEEIGVGRERFVAMELISPDVEDPAFVDPLWRLWLEMPPARNMFHAEGRTRFHRLLLRYAAIDWKRGPVSIDTPDGAKTVATWGIELTRVFDFVSVCVPDYELGWFACPFAKIDLQGMPRVGFVSPAGNTALMKRVPPEVLSRWPEADEMSLVFAVGQLLLGLVAVGANTSKTPLGKVILRCLDPKPQNRFLSLSLLRDALVEAGGQRNVPALEDRPQVWHHIEMGVGYASLGLMTRALHRFEWALLHAPDSQRATSGRDAMLAAGADPERAAIDQVERRNRVNENWIKGVVDDVPGWPPRLTRPWSESGPYASELEQAGQYAAALAVYHETICDPSIAPILDTAIARCHVGAREYGVAIDYARQALSLDPTLAEAHQILVEAMIAHRDLRDALDATEAWLPHARDTGIVHYTRAKVLLGLGRLAEARAELDLACELSPELLAAMLLRLHVDRSIKRVRTTVGPTSREPVDLPPHLRAVRDLLVAGHTADALALLDKPEHATDLQAQLLRADLLLFSDQLQAALTAYETIGGLSGKLGQATVLVRMGRAEDALALCDVLVREHPGASEPHEGRAAALQALGRHAEAEDAYKRALAANTQRSNARVRLGRG